MLREQLIGRALRQIAEGNLLRLSDLARMRYYRRDTNGLVGAYLPASVADGIAITAIDRSLNPRAAEYMRALGLAHHLLGHRGFDAYVYTPNGAAYVDADVERSARSLAAALLGWPESWRRAS